jgi:hypothetical protein
VLDLRNVHEVEFARLIAAEGESCSWMGRTSRYRTQTPRPTPSSLKAQREGRLLQENARKG